MMQIYDEKFQKPFLHVFFTSIYVSYREKCLHFTVFEQQTHIVFIFFVLLLITNQIENLIMKNWIFASLMSAVLAVMMTGCTEQKTQKSDTSKNDGADPAITKLKSTLNATTKDSLTVEWIEFEKEERGGSSRISAEFPVGDDSPLRRTVIDYIFECLDIYPSLETKFPSNTCDVAAFRKFLKEYTTTLCQNNAADQNDYAKSLSDDGEDSDYNVTWFTNISVQKAAETDLYVSYVGYSGEFMGGAHDQRGSRAATIRKADGAKLEDIFVEDAADNMQPILWKYLIEWQQPSDKDEYIAEINRFLKANYGITDYLHLSGAIYLAPDGVHLQYQPLDICFWPDEPELVIPYDEAKPFLTEEARKLIP